MGLSESKTLVMAARKTKDGAKKLDAKNYGTQLS